MSFLIDPPLLYSGGCAYKRATRDSDPSRDRAALAPLVSIGEATVELA
jgi:hypothetical protein